MTRVFGSQVIVQYHPDEVDSFIQLADLIEETFPDIAVEGEEDGARKGAPAILKDNGFPLYHLNNSEGPDADVITKVLVEAGYKTS